MFQKKILSPLKKKKTLDFEAVLWNTSALRVDLVERISRSFRVSQNFLKHIILKQFICLKKKKTKKKQNKRTKEKYPGARIP